MKLHPIILSAILSFFTATQVLADPIEIHGFGDLFSSQVKAKSGEEWFGVIKAGDSSTLVKGELKIERIIEEGESDEESRVRMHFKTVEKTFTWSDEGAPRFLVRGKSLKPGQLETRAASSSQEESRPLWLGLTHSFQPLKPWNAAIREPWLRLYATGSISESGDPQDLITTYCLHLALAEKSQKLICNPALATQPPTLVWAGDLDRDGKLDLVVDASGHEASTLLNLFISSSVKRDEIVKLVSSFQSSGC